MCRSADMQLASADLGAEDHSTVQAVAVVAVGVQIGGVVGEHAKLHDEMKKIMADPEMKKRVADIGLLPISLPPIEGLAGTPYWTNHEAVEAETLPASLIVLLAKWRDLMVVFFDENHARSIGLRPTMLRIVFFTLLAALLLVAPGVGADAPEVETPGAQFEFSDFAFPAGLPAWPPGSAGWRSARRTRSPRTSQMMICPCRMK